MKKKALFYRNWSEDYTEVNWRFYAKYVESN